MNLSSRWCVTALVALLAVACSDPVPPPAQGAFRTTIAADPLAPAQMSCPSGTSTQFDVPHVDPLIIPSEVLDADTYEHRIVDGDNKASVTCSVKGGDSFMFSGRLNGVTTGGAKASLEIIDGTLDASHKGTAKISLTNAGTLSSPLTSPSAQPCVVDASANTPTLEVKPGSMWASFTCPAVEAPPSDHCKASGFFVLENCAK